METMHLSNGELIFLAAWIICGSVLGFFSFIYDAKRNTAQNMGRCLLSVLMGIFLSVPLVHYLIDEHIFSNHMCILIGGIGGLGLPDIFLKYWSQISEKLLYRGLNLKKRRNDDRDID